MVVSAVLRPLSSEGALFSSSAISLHLASLGYPQKSINSMNKCQETNGDFVVSYCDCGKMDGVHALKHWCNLRTCLYCSKKRQRRIRRQYLSHLESLPVSRRTFLYFLTISPQNYDSLEYGLKDIRSSFVRLYQG